MSESKESLAERRITKEPAESYFILSKDRMDFARIFIYEGTRESSEHWGYISVISSFGNFGHSFSNTGPNPLKRFLIHLQFDYLMGKLFGPAVKEFDLEATLKSLERQVREGLKNEEMAPEEAQAFRACLKEIRESDITDPQGVMHLLGKGTGRFFNDWALWESLATKPNPQAVGFWERIWVDFVQELKRERDVKDRVAQAA